VLKNKITSSNLEIIHKNASINHKKVFFFRYKTLYLFSKLLKLITLNHSTRAIQMPLNRLTDFGALKLFPRFQR